LWFQSQRAAGSATDRHSVIRQMDASQRIIKEFDRLIAIGRENVLGRPYAERVVYYVVVARCEADMEGFSSIYEQALTADELGVLVDGLRQLGEPRLASEFASGLEALTKDAFYTHLNWNRVSDHVQSRIDEIGKSVGNDLWGLDEKLVALLDGDPAARPAG
jgi:hypothetical protein